MFWDDFGYINFMIFMISIKLRFQQYITLHVFQTSNFSTVINFGNFLPLWKCPPPTWLTMFTQLFLSLLMSIKLGKYKVSVNSKISTGSYMTEPGLVKDKVITYYILYFEVQTPACLCMYVVCIYIYIYIPFCKCYFLIH